MSESTEVAVLDQPADVGDVNVVALTPADMVPAQQELIAWCDRKIRSLNDEADELAIHQKLAVENGWKTSVVESSLNRTSRRILYYQKMQAALRAGYLLVPNMPIDVLAVRVNRARQPEETKNQHWGRFNAKPQPSLPAGVGRYVDETVAQHSRSYADVNDKGERVTKTQYYSGDYDEVDFPAALTKPVILEATARAMALRIFDEIGRVRNDGQTFRSKSDPIMVGRLHDPRKNSVGATFFIAWWVDTRSL
jgi:hypothetical protein